MEIVPTVGIGPIRFGMCPDEVRALFLEKETYEEWMGGNLNDSLLYRGLIVGFDAHDAYGPLPRGRFDQLRLNGRDDATIWGENISNWTKTSLGEYLQQHRIHYEVHDNGDVLVSSLSLSLAFDDSDSLQYIEMWRPR